MSSVFEREVVLDRARRSRLLVSSLSATKTRSKSRHSPIFSAMPKRTRSTASSRGEALGIGGAGGSLKIWAKGQSGSLQARKCAALYSPLIISRASLIFSKVELVAITNRVSSRRIESLVKMTRIISEGVT